MSDSLRDQLLGLGFKPAPASVPRTSGPGGHSARRPGPARLPADGKPQHGQPAVARTRARPATAPRPPHASEEFDLAKAYAIRAQKEKQERIQAERLKQEQARQRRAAKSQLAELVQDRALNDPCAEIARHFDYGGKIKRIHVTPAQLQALNAGDLGVVQLDGRYLLVTAALLEQAEALFAPAIALKVDPAAASADDRYADPQYQVPDDLIW